MSVTCQQLFRTSVPGRGFVTAKSAQLPDSLVAQVVDPIDFSAIAGFQEGRALYLLGGSGGLLIALSYLIKALDDHQRPFIHNHTLFLSQGDYVALGAHPEALESSFTKPGKFQYSGATIDPIPLGASPAKAFAPVEEDIQRVRKSFPNVDSVAQLMTAIEGRRRFELALGGGPQEIVQILYAFLKVLPPELRLAPFASFTPRVEYLDRFLFTVARINTAGFTSQITRQSGPNTPPKEPIMALARAVHSGDPQQLPSAWEVLSKTQDLGAALATVRDYLSLWRLNEAETELTRLRSVVASAAGKENHKKRYDSLVITLQQRRKVEEFLGGLDGSKAASDKLGRVVQALNDTSVSPQFKYDLVSACLERFQPQELEAQGVLQFLLNSPAALPEMIRQGTILLDRLVLVAASSHSISVESVMPIFQFDGSSSVFEALEKNQERPYFLLCLDQLARLRAADPRFQPFVAKVLIAYIDGLREAFNQQFRVLPRPQWPRYARRVFSAFQSGGVATMRQLATTWKAPAVSQKWDDFLQRLQAVFAGT